MWAESLANALNIFIESKVIY